MHIFTSEYQIANPASIEDGRMKEIRLRVIINQGKSKKCIQRPKSTFSKACGVEVYYSR